MNGAIFYVKDVNGNLVAAQYLLQSNGQPIVDPNTSAAQTRSIYGSNGALLAQQNVNGYLVVPADYSISNAITFARLVANQLEVTSIGPGGETVGGLNSALELMTGAFVP
jgi:hypothetical protein